MKTNSTQQEILLMTGTTFSSRQFSDRDDDGKKSKLSEREQLEEACWNGLLPQMLPEIYEHPKDDKKLYMWQITEAASFIEIELGELPEEKEKIFSIDPYSFLPLQFLS
ncbi:MAG: hypothetical protein ABJA57_05750 [Ginsengibacter sp.]